MSPEPVGYPSPKECQQAVAAVNNGYMSFTLYGFDNALCNLFRVHKHGIVSAIVEQSRAYKAWTYVCEANVELPHVGLLLQCL